MKVLSIDKHENEYRVYIEKNGKYYLYSITPKKQTEIVDYPDIKNYGHFVNVIWKFDNFVWFTKEPYEISKLDYDTIQKVHSYWSKKYWNGKDGPEWVE